MGLETLLELKGVQGVLVQVVKAAAPQLTETIEGFAGLLKDFINQLDRVEQNQQQILTVLGADYAGTGNGNSAADNRGQIGGNVIAINGTGKQTDA